MKKGLLLIVLMVFGWVGVASATTWTDTYYPDDIPLYMTAGDSEYISFDITNDGFDATFWGDWSRDVAIWAKVELYVTDDIKPWYDGFDWRGSDEALTITTDFLWYDVNEATYNVDFHGGLINDPLLYDIDLLGLISLNKGGDMDLTLSATLGDFYFWGAEITASDTAPVPEPGTLLLLGTGLAGLAFYRRKKMT